jgi:ElaA protein
MPEPVPTTGQIATGHHAAAEHAAGAVRRAAWHELDPRTLHDLVRLRVDVFVVEQGCPYPELDGRDVEPATEHWWTSDDQGPTSYLRVLAEPDGSGRVGRVVTRLDARGRGLGGRLMDEVLAVHGHRTLVLDAQVYVTAFYEARGFEATGPEYLDDGIPHVPMRRPGTS